MAKKDVDPHPLVGTPGLQLLSGTSPKSGSTMLILSSIAMPTFKVNVYVNDVAADVTGYVRCRVLCVSVECSTSVDRRIDVALISGTPARETATVRELKSAACVFALVVIPDPTVTVHTVPAGKVSPPATRVRVALLPEPVVDAENDVVPQLLTVDTLGELNVKSGRTTSMVSPASRTAFNENRSETGDAALVTGLKIISSNSVIVGVGATTSVEVSRGTALMSAASEKVMAAVRLDKSELWTESLTLTSVEPKPTLHMVPAFSIPT